MYQSFQRKPCFIYDEQGLYCNNSMWIIPTDNKALLGVLNSRMGWWLITKFCSNLEGMYQLIWQYFGKIPIPKKLPKTLGTLADSMLSLHAELQLQRKRFLETLTDHFDGLKITGKLQHFEELEFKQVIAELKKQKKSPPLNKEHKWRHFFKESKRQIETIRERIRQTDPEIDRMVYALYGLTDEEIGIVNRE